MQEKFVDIIADERGQVTVFLTLIFMILMGAIFCVLEGMNIYMETSLSEETFKMPVTMCCLITAEIFLSGIIYFFWIPERKSRSYPME